MKVDLCKIPGCINEGRYCRLHLNYSVPVEKKINKVSDNHKETLKEYKKVRKEFLNDHPQCMAKLQGCKGKANQGASYGREKFAGVVRKQKILFICLWKLSRNIRKEPRFCKSKRV
jgi:hypothetical protein